MEKYVWVVCYLRRGFRGEFDVFNNPESAFECAYGFIEDFVDEGKLDGDELRELSRGYSNNKDWYWVADLVSVERAEVRD